MKIRNFLAMVVIAMFITTAYLAGTNNINYSIIPLARAEANAPPSTPQQCPLYVQPKLPELPTIEPISDKMINDRKLAEDHLLNIIKEHRKAMIETNKVIEASYQEYVKKCLDSETSKSKQKSL